jgi:hypothetical protein
MPPQRLPPGEKRAKGGSARARPPNGSGKRHYYYDYYCNNYTRDYNKET